MQYDRAIFYTKKGNLSDYLHTDKVAMRICGGNVSERTRAYYEAERDIQLIALIRFDTIPVSTRRGMDKRKVCYCKIKCPVNPLPVKGEFELPSLEAMHQFLKANGWEFKQTLETKMFE